MYCGILFFLVLFWMFFHEVKPVTFRHKDWPDPEGETSLLLYKGFLAFFSPNLREESNVKFPLLIVEMSIFFDALKQETECFQRFRNLDQKAY